MQGFGLNLEGLHATVENLEGMVESYGALYAETGGDWPVFMATDNRFAMHPTP